MTAPTVQSPFPYYGGKSKIAATIWERFGNVGNYVEPFAGSLAVLLQRPYAPGIETVNDKDAFICNVFRALAAEPAAVAAWCDRQPNEADLHAVHTWLVAQRATFTTRLMGDPDYYDVRVAGRWLYGICLWIGGGWCSGNGPWQSVEGQLQHLGNSGRGVHRQLLHLGGGRGVHRQLLHLRDSGQGVHRQHGGLLAWFHALHDRLRDVRVCCGDWSRVMGDSVTHRQGLTGIVLDPPYSQDEDRDDGLYAIEDLQVAHAVRAWCVVHGAHPLLRIAYCGYRIPGPDPLVEAGWQCVPWKTNGGFGNQSQGRGRVNAGRECVWFNTSCLDPTQRTLF